jgi:hypothetical protein
MYIQYQFLSLYRLQQLAMESSLTVALVSLLLANLLWYFGYGW